jgi:cyanophycinase
LGELHSLHAEEKLLQRFWDEAGSYGARIVIIDAARSASKEKGSHYAAQLAAWESDTVQLLTLRSRADALQPAAVDAVQAATAILILGDDPLRLAAQLGGTPLAQSIRRANAQSKAVCAVGGCASVLCQHMIAFPSTERLVHPSRAIQFAPGLGIVNRMALDSSSKAAATAQEQTQRLLIAVAYNPFLVGVALDADTGAVIYPDSTLEVFGEGIVHVVDGSQMSETNLHEAGAETPLTVVGAEVHVLSRGYTFNFDNRSVRAPSPDAALQVEAVKAAF